MRDFWFRRRVVSSALAIYMVGPGLIWAQNIEDRIQQQERAASQLREELEKQEREISILKEQQIELKKEATTAAESLPSFTYRPGNGLLIEASDKSWSLRTSMETHFRMLFESGRDQAGRTKGEIMARRFRPYWFFCIENCLWEIETALDLDGFAGNSVFQRAAVHLHLERLNPWLPAVSFGGDVSASIGVARQGSSAVGTQAEYDLLTRNTFDDGSSGQGILLNWDNRPLDAIGIPGRISRLQIGMASVQSGADDTQRNTDRKDYVAYLGVNPFSQVKNKWLSGLLFETGAWFCNNDDRGGVSSGCNQLRIRELGNGGRQTLFDTGTTSIGRGLATLVVPGLAWEVGPYMLRVAGGFQRYHDDGITRGRKTGNMFLIGHDLFLWSPKGFLTGSANTAGSILVGTHFERTDVACEIAALCASINGGEFHRNRILLREWDIFYFVAPRMSVGATVLWYDASNLRTGRTNAGENLGVFPVGCSLATCRGRGGDWVDGMLNFRYQW